MSLSSGPNSATLGLVFAYDTGDRTNSYIGQPTTNIWDGVQYSIYNQDATNYRNQTFPLPPVPGYEVVKVVTNTPGSYGHSILWKAPYPNNNVATITNSIYAWMESGTYVQVGQHWYPWYYGTQKNIPKSQWVRISETYVINEGSSYSVAALTYSTDGAAYFSMPQYEYTSFPSPFLPANGTRSVTQGLLPLTGSSINLTDVSYNNSGQITFDGTNDYINTDFTSGYEGTIELIIKCSDYNGDIPFSLDSDNYSSGPNIYFAGNTICWNTGDSQDNAFTNSAYPNSNYHHLVITNQITGAALYIDGVLVGTAAGRNMTTTGSNKLWLGRFHGGGYYFNGELPIVRLYNRPLNFSEVKDNYKGYKTRFNLT